MNLRIGPVRRFSSPGVAWRRMANRATAGRLDALTGRKNGASSRRSQNRREAYLVLAPKEGGRSMNTITARGLSLAAVVAIWTAISHLGRFPVQSWPVIVGLACFLAAGGGIPGLQKSIASSLSGVVWVLLYVAVSRALGRQEILTRSSWGRPCSGSSCRPGCRSC